LERVEVVIRKSCDDDASLANTFSAAYLVSITEKWLIQRPLYRIARRIGLLSRTLTITNGEGFNLEIPLTSVPERP
jgi:hypothetical protein